MVKIFELLHILLEVIGDRSGEFLYVIGIFPGSLISILQQTQVELFDRPQMSDNRSDVIRLGNWSPIKLVVCHVFKIVLEIVPVRFHQPDSEFNDLIHSQSSCRQPDKWQASRMSCR